MNADVIDFFVNSAASFTALAGLHDWLAEKLDVELVIGGKASLVRFGKVAWLVEDGWCRGLHL